MSKKDQARIEAFLEAQKIPERRLGAYKPKFYAAMKQALDDNRLGNKSAVRQEMKGITGSLRVVHAIKEENVADFVKALAAFISRHGQFSFSKVLKKNTSKLGGISKMFHSKGVLAAEAECEKLYMVMVNAGDIPAGISMARFKQELDTYDCHVTRYYNITEQSVGKAKWSGLIRHFKLQRGGKKDLHTLAMAIYNKGSKHQVVKVMACDIIAASGGSRTTTNMVDDFIALVVDELLKAGKR